MIVVYSFTTFLNLMKKNVALSTIRY